MLGIFFLSSADFSKLFFSKISFKNIIAVASSLEPDQARHTVKPGLMPNCLHRLSADDNSCCLSGKRVKPSSTGK